MTKRLNLLAALATGLICAWAQNSEAQSISGFTPVFGAPGEQIEISGAGFSNPVTVRFNGVPSPFAGATQPDLIVAQVPNGATSGKISLSTGGPFVFSAQDFTVIGPGPYVTGFSPAIGSGGTRVTVNGVHFSTVNDVKFNGVSGNGGFIGGDTVLEINAPANVTTGPITVISPQGSFTTATNFFAPPVITGFSPGTGRLGTNVAVSGRNFTGATSLTIGGVSVPFTINSATQLVATISAGALTGILSLSAPGGGFNTSSNFVVQPLIQGFTPTVGVPATSVTITGQNFLGNPVVRFNGVQSPPVTGVSYGQLTAVVPNGASSGPISITTTNGSHTNTAQLFHLPPRIFSFTPTNSAPGSTVTITGTNLLGTSSVHFNGAPASFTPPTNNATLLAVVPAGVTTGPISVTAPAGTTNSTGLFYGLPVVNSFSPASGFPGTNVTISGINFLGATLVLFNGLPASFTPPTNNGSLNAVVPAGATTGPISVVGPAGAGTSLASFVVANAADLAATAGASTALATVGVPFTYTVTVTNLGPFESPATFLTNHLDAGVVLQSVTTSGGTVSTNGHTLRFSFGTLTANSSRSASIVVMPQAAGTVVNQVTVTGANNDPAPGNNSVMVVTPVQPTPRLAITHIPPQQVRLTWNSQLTNYLPQFSTTLPPVNQWSNVTTPPFLVGTQWMLFENISGATRYYRLKRE